MRAQFTFCSSLSRAFASSLDDEIETDLPLFVPPETVEEEGLDCSCGVERLLSMLSLSRDTLLTIPLSIPAEMFYFDFENE